MRGDDAPTFGKSHPYLTLSALEAAPPGLSSEFECDAAQVPSKCNYVESVYGACKVHSGPAFSEGGDFLNPVQVFRSSKAQCILGIPKHRCQSLSIVRNQGGFIPRVKCRQLGNDLGIVDDHR